MEKHRNELLQLWRMMDTNSRVRVFNRVNKQRAHIIKTLEESHTLSDIPLGLAYVIMQEAETQPKREVLKVCKFEMMEILTFDQDRWGARRIEDEKTYKYFVRKDVSESLAKKVAWSLKSTLILSADKKQHFISAYKKIPLKRIFRFIEEVDEEMLHYDRIMLQKYDARELYKKVQKAAKEWEKILQSIGTKQQSHDTQGVMFPVEAFRQLKNTIIGQEEALKSLLKILYWHQKMVLNDIQKFLVKPPLIIGETGSGKTHLIEQVCELYQCDVLFVDASSMVSTGIRGNSTDEILKNILRHCNYDISRAEKSVVVLDEIDKLVDNTTYGTSVLHQLLRFVEGGVFPLEISQSYESEEFKKIKEIDTRNMLFIFAGSFQYYVEKNRNENTSKMGFVHEYSKVDDTYYNIVEKSGLPKELMGRIGDVITLKKLNIQDFIHILTKTPHSPLKKIESMLALNGMTLSTSKKEIEAIAREAAASPYGARALEKEVLKRFEPLLYQPMETKKNIIIEYKDFCKILQSKLS